MYFLIVVSILVYNFHTGNGNQTANVQTSNDVGAVDIAEAFLILLGYDKNNESPRLKELKDKIEKIDSYVVDRDSYTNLLMNEIKRNNFNATNFYKSLIEEDHFRIWNDSKSLYLKMKEKMNRDDVMKILSERGEEKVMRYARRMMADGYVVKKYKEKQLDDVVDKFLGETAADDHKFNEEDRYSKYWDPQSELEQRFEKSKLKSGRRLFKGERTTIQYYPFVVSIHIMGRFWCGGVIYWNDLILTSASCLQLMHNNRFFRENPRALAVRVGSNHSRIGGELVDALEVYFHPAYNPRSLRNNIALIRLVRHLKFNYHRTPKLIKISTNEGGVPFTAEVMLLGWGVTKTSQKLSYEPIFLQSKKLPVYPNKMCAEAYGKKFVSKNMFCAGTITTGEGACDHDAGGPAILNGKLVGIISYGPTICGFPDAPTVFTLVGAYTDWIETVNETMPGYYRGLRKRTTTTTQDPVLMYFQTATAPRTFAPITVAGDGPIESLTIKIQVDRNKLRTDVKTEKNREKIKEKSREKIKEKSIEKIKEKSMEKIREKSEEKIKDKSIEKNIKATDSFEDTFQLLPLSRVR